MPQRFIRYMLFGIAVFGMLACDSLNLIHYVGATELCYSQNGNLLVYETELSNLGSKTNPSVELVISMFQSKNGGLLWDEIRSIVDYRGRFMRRIEAHCPPQTQNYFELIETQHYNFIILPNNGIYRIDEEGKETKEFDLSFYTHEARIFMPLIPCSGPFYDFVQDDFNERPVIGINIGVNAITGATVDKVTGNLLVLTRLDGALVRTPDAKWQWVAIGDCQYLATQDPRNLLNILWPELWLMLPIIPLYALITARRLGGFRYSLMVVIFVPWMPALFLPRYTGDYTWLALLFPIYVSALLSTLHLLWISYDKSLHIFTRLGMILGLFLAPYLLWVWGILPYHRLAAAISLGLTIWGLYRVHQKIRKPVVAPQTPTEHSPQSP